MSTEPEQRTVQLDELRGLVGHVRWFLAWGVALTLVVVWALVQVDNVNDAQDRADAREAHEDDLELAQVCKDGHERYAAFEPLILDLVEAAAIVGADANLTRQGSTPEEIAEVHEAVRQLMPAQLQPILEAYPPPACDYEAALRVLEAG